MGDFVIGPFYICSLAQTHFGDAGGGGGGWNCYNTISIRKKGGGGKEL